MGYDLFSKQIFSLNSELRAFFSLSGCQHAHNRDSQKNTGEEEKGAGCHEQTLSA